MRDELYEARREFFRIHLEQPTLIFVSPEAHTRMCDALSDNYGEKHTTFVGATVMGMAVHLVPTLTKGFHVA